MLAAVRVPTAGIVVTVPPVTNYRQPQSAAVAVSLGRKPVVTSRCGFNAEPAVGALSLRSEPREQLQATLLDVGVLLVRRRGLEGVLLLNRESSIQPLSQRPQSRSASTLRAASSSASRAATLAACCERASSITASIGVERSSCSSLAARETADAATATLRAR